MLAPGVATSSSAATLCLFFLLLLHENTAHETTREAFSDNPEAGLLESPDNWTNSSKRWQKRQVPVYSPLYAVIWAVTQWVFSGRGLTSIKLCFMSVKPFGRITKQALCWSCSPLLRIIELFGSGVALLSINYGCRSTVSYLCVFVISPYAAQSRNSCRLVLCHYIAPAALQVADGFI